MTPSPLRVANVDDESASLLPVVVQIFAREPVTGQCKRRLIPALGAKGSARLHAAMVRRTLSAAMSASQLQQGFKVELWSAQDSNDAFLRAQARLHGCDFKRQHAGDLGARMLGAVADATAQRYGAVIIGTDCPSMTSVRIAAAVDALRRGYPVIMRPATDGGYVCIGMQQAHASLFSDIEWGSARVAGQTRQRLIQTRIRWLELAALPDIDRPADLALLPTALLPTAL